MQATELDEIGTCEFERKDNSERINELEALEENCGEKELNSDSTIDVSGQILDFPLSYGKESMVEEIYMYKNDMYLIPRVVGRFKGLKTLKFFANEMNLFPGEFRDLMELECLQVKVTEPGVSRLEISRLEKLKELELSRAPPKPSAFPILNDLAGLKCLTRLSVCHFAIRYLPPEIGCLNNLEYLDLSFNKMRNLPEEITFLNMLISLKVSNNKLVELPSGFSDLQKLESLDVSNNRLTSLGSIKLELMHNLQSLDLQHNQLRGFQIPSWICCNLEGNSINLANDESAEMDVYEGAIREINNSPYSSIAPLSHASGLSPNNRCLAARRSKGWKRRYNSKTKARQERLSNCMKWKASPTCQSSSQKCMTCKVSVSSDNTASEGLSVITNSDLNDQDIFPEGEEDGNSIVGPGYEDFTGKKGSVDGCSCPIIDVGSSMSNENLDSLSDAVEVPNEDLASEASNCIIKSKRHSEKYLANPKPTKYLRPTNDPSYLSCQYSEVSFCGVGDFLPDGFYDAGRDRPFMPLANYEKHPNVNSREVILLDREMDEELDAILLCARSLINKFRQMHSSGESSDFAADNLQLASLLALFVSDHFGGSDKTTVIQRTRKAVSGSKYSKPFVCTCATRTGADTTTAHKQSADTAEDCVFLDFCEKSLRSLKEKQKSIIVPIGVVQFGVCRHRALLMKYLCDRMEPQIPCELVRGYLGFMPHAWNVVSIKRGESLVRIIIDACNPLDIREESDPEYVCRYIPLNRVSGIVADHDAIGTFPSISEGDEIQKMASTSLVCCNVGSLEVAVKVRTIDTAVASPVEIRNFELSCLGEVRMLSVLKHPCIVEFYGHRISSNWSQTADGDSEGRTLQSAIMMEYIKGGSLKNYMDKLSSYGEKQVAPNLVLSIARDVASALSELHAKQIIHRDIKSENILIDLEKKQQDGTPVVKMCDFDKAIPLHSSLHTCCIAHVGVPPPDICVGTPRWMAPEVFRAMDKRNMYGLEVDVWSFGCLLLELLTLQVPYFGLPESDIHNLLQIGERPKLPDELETLAQTDGDIESESEAIGFLAKLYHWCTQKNPSDRPSAENIYELLRARTGSDNVSRNSGND